LRPTFGIEVRTERIIELRLPMTTTFRYGNPAFDCDGAQIHAHCRQLATVVGISGAIHPNNLDRLTAYASRFVLGDKPFVLDLSGVRSLHGDCGSLLDAVDERCDATGVEWAVVACDEVVDAFRLTDDDSVTIASSLPVALNHFADEIGARRRLLLPMLGKTA
jgi:anti-anti-sigma regulatory factor